MVIALSLSAICGSAAVYGAMTGASPWVIAINVAASIANGLIAIREAIKEAPRV